MAPISFPRQRVARPFLSRARDTKHTKLEDWTMLHLHGRDRDGVHRASSYVYCIRTSHSVSYAGEHAHDNSFCLLLYDNDQAEFHEHYRQCFALDLCKAYHRIPIRFLSL